MNKEIMKYIYLLSLCFFYSCSLKINTDGVYIGKRDVIRYVYLRIYEDGYARYCGTQFTMSPEMAYHSLRMYKGDYYRGPCSLLGDTIMFSGKRRTVINDSLTLIVKKNTIRLKEKGMIVKLKYQVVDTVDWACPPIVNPTLH